MKQTQCFKRRVLGERPYTDLAWCETAVREPEATEVQPDGRVRHWRFVPELDECLRVVPLEDGETPHNAFPDRPFKPPPP